VSSYLQCVALTRWNAEHAIANHEARAVDKPPLGRESDAEACINDSLIAMHIFKAGLFGSAEGLGQIERRFAGQERAALIAPDGGGNKF